MKRIALALFALFVATAAAVAAPTLQVQSGLLVGIQNVEIGGQLYDVQFLDGTCAGLHADCAPGAAFAFSSLAQARQASTALNSLIVNSALGQFDSVTELTRGCTDMFRCYAVTPYGWTSGVINVDLFVNGANSIGDTYLTTTSLQTYDSTQWLDGTWAVWSRVASEVPEPQTAALLALGLLGLAFSRRSPSVATQTL